MNKKAVWLPIGMIIKGSRVACVGKPTGPHILCWGDKCLLVYLAGEGTVIPVCLPCLGRAHKHEKNFKYLPMVRMLSATNWYTVEEDGGGSMDTTATVEYISRAVLKADSRCQQCFKPRVRAKCGGCNLVRYCDSACQAQDWARHKKFCSQKGNWEVFFQ